MCVCVCSCDRERRFQSVVSQSLGGVIVTRPTVRQQWRAIQTRERKLTLVARFAIQSCFCPIYRNSAATKDGRMLVVPSSPMCVCVWQASSLHTRSPGGANDFTIVMSPDRTKPLKLLRMCPRASVYPSLNGGFQTV